MWNVDMDIVDTMYYGKIYEYNIREYGWMTVEWTGLRFRDWSGLPK